MWANHELALYWCLLPVCLIFEEYFLIRINAYSSNCPMSHWVNDAIDQNLIQINAKTAFSEARTFVFMSRYLRHFLALKSDHSIYIDLKKLAQFWVNNVLTKSTLCIVHTHPWIELPLRKSTVRYVWINQSIFKLIILHQRDELFYGNAVVCQVKEHTFAG